MMGRYTFAPMRRPSVLLAVLLLAACATRPAPPPALPSGDVWIEHLNRDLKPFWTMPDALGDPVGNFPTFRCHDGRRFDRVTNPCPELTEAGSWIRDNLDREFLRMQSRQTYFYGVAYHLTGDARMLELARAGAAWIRKQPDDPAATTQDLAYAQLGPAMLYYLTRDPEVLADLLERKHHIFRTYDDGEGLLLWVTAGEDRKRRELVSQLDQINAYMLLLAPILPEPHRTEWKRDLVRLADGMVTRYWDEGEGMFRGTIHDPAQKLLGSRHADFGHTIKALWMIERVGRFTGRGDLVAFAKKNAPRVLQRAWIEDTGCWATGIRADASLDRTLVWWSFAELDQMTATLALTDRAAARDLPAAYRCWFAKLVDPENHEVWGFVDPDNPSRHSGKAHLWKNGYHSAEHALVGYLAAQELHGQPATLWFAFDAKRADVRAYVFDARVKAIAGGRVTFARLR
jgi:mannose/cellobiose epimerase-like protein (N-acyl-D-glucosamine 2-epimerase family)